MLRERLYILKFDSTGSFDPESFNPELTTDGLVASHGSVFCGSLVLESIRRSVINIQRSMFDVQGLAAEEAQAA